MVTLRFIVVLLLLSVFLVSCHEPFISVEVRTGGEVMPYPPPYQGPPEPGCWPPFSACPGMLNLGEVAKIDKSGPITWYTIKIGKHYRPFSEPPTVVEGTIEKGNTVEIITSDDGTVTLKKAS